MRKIKRSFYDCKCESNCIFMFLFCSILLVSFFPTHSARKLIFIQCVTRHGVRYPSYPNNYDYSNITTQKLKSQLTAEGKQMMFLLGRQLYKTYWSQLFQGTEHQKLYDSSMIYGKSTNRNRTIQSLQNLLAGLLSELQPDSKIEKLKENTNFLFSEVTPQNQLINDQYYSNWKNSHFVPIHVEKGAQGDPDVAYMKNEGDFLVKQELNLCPNQEKWADQNLKSSFVTSLMKEETIQTAISKLRPYFSTLPLQFQTIFQYVDNYYCLKAIEKKYLQIFEDPNIKQYLGTTVIIKDFLYIARLYAIYTLTDVQIKTFSKTLLQQTINNMRKAISQQGSSLVFYSGHDITIAFLLRALNFTNLPCLYQTYMLNQTVENCYSKYPGFGSAFIFEVYQEEDSSFSIQVSINGKHYPIPICNFSQSCPLTYFEAWFKNWTIKGTPNQVCGVNTEGSYFYQIPLSFAFGMAVAYFLYYILAKAQKKEVGHQKVTFDEEL